MAPDDSLSPSTSAERTPADHAPHSPTADANNDASAGASHQGNPRYVILGTGAVGGTIGARLAQAGVPTVWVARGEHGQVLRERGLTLLTPEGSQTLHAEVWLDPSEAHLGPDDVLVAATKTQHLPDLLAARADVELTLPDGTRSTAGEALPLVLATNGLAAEQVAPRWFERVFGVCVWAPTVHLEPGVVVARLAQTSAVLHCSRVPAQQTTDADRALLARMRDDFARAHLDLPLPDDVLPWKHRKLLSNLHNAVQALVGEQSDDPDAVAVGEAAEHEARTLMAATGLPVVPDDVERATRERGPRIAAVPGAPGQLGGSTWQSLSRGVGNVETDYLNGEIVLLARRLGREAPINLALARLCRQAAASGARPGDLDAASLRRLVGV